MADILSTTLQGTQQNPSRPAETRPTDPARSATAVEDKETQGETKADGNPSPEAVRAAVADTDPKRILGGRKVEFAYDDELDQVIVTVKDQETGDTIREVPPKEFLEMAAKFREMFGILFDKTA